MNEVQEVPECDVLIVGAGPTGLTLANLLAGHGVAAMLIDSKTGPVEEPRAVSVDDEALRVMQLAGAYQYVARHMVPNTGFRMISPGGRCIACISPTRAELGFPKRSNVHQPRFEADLLECLRNRASVQLRLGTTLLELEQAGSHVIAIVRDANGSMRRIRSRYVAACDGGRSTARRLLGVAMPGVTAPQRWLVVDLLAAPSATLESLVFADARRPRVFIPGPLGHQRWEFMVLPGEDPERIVEPANVRALLKEYGVENPDICSTRVYTFHGRCVEQWQVGRVLLLGDAAHLNPPFGGQGMINGIRDASNLAWKLAYVLQGRAAPSLLATYPMERTPAMFDSIRLAMRLAWIMMPRTRLQGWLQNLAVGLLYRFPSTRAYVAEMRFRPRARMRSGFLAAATQRPSPVVGLMCAQPATLHNAPQGRALDDAFGSGFGVVVLGSQALRLVERLPAAWMEQVRPAIVVLEQGGETRAGAMIVSHPDAHRIEVSAHERAYFESSWGRLLVVRPDRYVMAELSEENFSQVSARLASLFEEFCVRAAIADVALAQAVM